MLDGAAQQPVTTTVLRKFAATARKRMRIEGGGYRRDHLRALVQRVEVDDREVRIMGSKSDLFRALAAISGVKSATGGVRSSVLDWRRGSQSIPIDVKAVFHSSKWKPTVLPTSHWPIPCARCAQASAPSSVDLDAAAGQARSRMSTLLKPNFCKLETRRPIRTAWLYLQPPRWGWPPVLSAAVQDKDARRQLTAPL
jgi:hypothetical protein